MTRSITTAGELRGFLAEVLLGIRSGSIDTEEAIAIAKVSAQINQSLAVEVNTALQLQKMGKDQPVAGSMMLTSGGQAEATEAHLAALAQNNGPEVPVAHGGGIWCDQCEMRVSSEDAAGCKSKFCKAKAP